MAHAPETGCPYNFDPAAGPVVFSFDTSSAPGGAWVGEYSLDGGATWTRDLANLGADFISVALPGTTRNDQVVFRYGLDRSPNPISWAYSDKISVSPRGRFAIVWEDTDSLEWEAVDPKHDADSLLGMVHKPAGGLSDRIQATAEILDNREISFEGSFMPLSYVSEIQHRIMTNLSRAVIWLHDGMKIEGHVKSIDPSLPDGLSYAGFKITVVV